VARAHSSERIAADVAIPGGHPVITPDAGPRPADVTAADLSRRSRLSSATMLLIAGVVVFAVMMACYCAFIFTHPLDRWLVPVDLHVYRLGGKVVAQLAPTYDPKLAAPLYNWPGDGLQFTYPPFAAVVFTVLLLPSWALLLKLSIAVNIAALAVAIWATLGALGYRAGSARLGGTLLLAAALFWIEPVQRTLYLGQIELVLMALIMWDLGQPDRRWWKGAGVGIAAGIKLVPLVFIPYLLLTRRFRQAAVAGGTFAATALIGAVVLPADSRAWWLDGLFLKSSRTGFVGWEGNQSLQALITRLSGSIAAGERLWLVAACITLIVGIASAVALDRAGHRTVGVLTCALTGLLVSPISWDHHWVWVAPGVTVLVVYGIRARRSLRWTYVGAAGLLAAIFGAWPGFLWGQPLDLGGFSEGLIWIPPNTNPGTFAQLGDRPWYAEYHWHGFQLITGNLFVLTGLVVFVQLAVLAVTSEAARRRVAGGPAGVADPADLAPNAVASS
jgi:alpha-1,2-mannosyltransferase